MRIRPGPGPLTHARVVKIALPVVLSNATVPILGLVDAGVIGQLGEAAPIAAVGLGAATLAIVYWIFGFLRMGTAGLAAQAIGAGDRAEDCALLTRVLLIAGAAGLAIIALQWLIFQARLPGRPGDRGGRGAGAGPTCRSGYCRPRPPSPPMASAAGWSRGNARLACSGCSFGQTG